MIYERKAYLKAERKFERVRRRGQTLRFAVMFAVPAVGLPAAILFDSPLPGVATIVVTLGVVFPLGLWQISYHSKRMQHLIATGHRVGLRSTLREMDRTFDLSVAWWTDRIRELQRRH